MSSISAAVSKEMKEHDLEVKIPQHKQGEGQELPKREGTDPAER